MALAHLLADVAFGWADTAGEAHAALLIVLNRLDYVLHNEVVGLVGVGRMVGGGHIPATVVSTNLQLTVHQVVRRQFGTRRPVNDRPGTVVPLLGAKGAVFVGTELEFHPLLPCHGVDLLFLAPLLLLGS